MKKYDKNSLIGFLLMAIILIVFNTFVIPEAPQKQTEQDSETLNSINQTDVKESTLTKIITPNITDSSSNKIGLSQELIAMYGDFAHCKIGEEAFHIIENEKIKVTITNKGGRITSVIMKEHKTFDGLPLDLFDADSSKFNLQFNTDKYINTGDLFFTAEESNNSLSMKLKANDYEYIEYLYTITDDYLVDFDIKLVGMERLLSKGNVPYMILDWKMRTPQTEKSKENQDAYTGIQYQVRSDEEVDYLSFSSTDEEEITAQLNWIAFKQQFFSTIFLAKNGFQKPTHLTSTQNPEIENENSKFIKDLSANFELPYKEEKLSFQFYFIPNHYKDLKAHNKGFEELIPLGWGIFGWVNQYIIINIFDVLDEYFASYGIIILLLTLIIKIGLAPFTYKAFLSQAKMKVLKPQIDEITAKNKGKDQMKIQQETMNLYRRAGVNPMGGCLPMLFQFPILIAMFQFFPASIELRQQAFLWADDLSSYDSIYNLGFSIPFYGDHISLFTLLMTISTLFYTRMNSSMATGQMAQMKWMMYLMPIMFLGFFNNYAAGLTYYYFLANMFTMTQQYFMKRFINEDLILAQLEANKKKPPKPKSKFQKKLEAIQKQQEQKMRKRK